jgi:hypothetical protein
MIFLSDGVEHCYGLLIAVITAKQYIIDGNLSPTAIQQDIHIYLLYSKRSKKVGKESMFYPSGSSSELESRSKIITSSSKLQVPIDGAVGPILALSRVTVLSSPFSVILQGFAYAC